MIVVKGSHVWFGHEDAWRNAHGERRGSWTRLPSRLGVAHDPQGELLARHEIYFLPYRVHNARAPSFSAAKRYFGPRYDLLISGVDFPKGQWNHLHKVIVIDYRRPAGLRLGDGAIHEGDYTHAFAFPQPLWRAGQSYCLVLPTNAIVNERGFVYP